MRKKVFYLGLCSIVSFFVAACTFICETGNAILAKKRFEGKYSQATYSDSKAMDIISNNAEIIHIECSHETDAIDYNSIFDTVRIIKLETTEKSVIGYIDKVVINNDNIFIIDKRLKVVRSFDLDGRFLNDIGTMGNGPGEYISPIDICISDSIVNVLDDAQNKIIRYRFDGSFVDETQVPFFALQFATMRNGDYVFRGKNSHNYHLGDLHDYYIWVCDSTMKIKQKGFYYNQPNINFCPMSYFSKQNDDIYFTDFVCDTIYQVKDEQLEKRYILDFSSNHNIDEINRYESKYFDRALSTGELALLEDFVVVDQFVFITIAMPYARTYVYNKLTKETIEKSKFISDGKEEHNICFPIMVGTYGDYIVCYENVEAIKSWDNIDKWIKDVPEDHYLRQIFDNSNDDDNPVIILMHPRK